MAANQSRSDHPRMKNILCLKILKIMGCLGMLALILRAAGSPPPATFLPIPVQAKADYGNETVPTDTPFKSIETDTSLATAGAGGPGNPVYLPFIIRQERSNFHYGVLDPAGFVGYPPDFSRYIQDWQSRGLDAALLIGDVPDLTVSDSKDFKIIASPLDELDKQWFYYEYYHDGAPLCEGNVTIDCARNIISPIVDPIKNHPSVRGYYIFDDATTEYKERIRLAIQIFQERDRLNPASPGLLELGNGQYIYEYTHPEAFITYDYPVLNKFPVCNFTRGSYRDWVDRTRETMQGKLMSVPYWAILQTHGSPTNSLRTPTVEEVRLLNWLALGEDAKGIFWFTWSTVPGEFWTGVKDNPSLLAEITDLARRVNILRPYLETIRKTADQFQVSPALTTYGSTLKDFKTGKLYVLAANHSCSPQSITISSPFYTAKLKDLESGAIINLQEPLLLRGGDGKLFEVIEAAALPTPTPQANLVQNPSFETDIDVNGTPDNWYPAASAIQDTTVAHSGSASLKVTGPATTASTQWVTLKPNTKYYASWYMRAQNLVESYLGFSYVQTNPSITTLEYVFWDQNGSYDWVKRVGFFTTPSDYASGKVSITWDVAAGSTFWIDDLTLCEADLPCADAYLLERN